MLITKQQLADMIAKNPNIKPSDIVNGITNRGWEIEGYNQKDTFIKSLGRDIIRPFAQGTEAVSQGVKTFGSVLKGGAQMLGGDKLGAQQTIANRVNEFQQQRSKPLNILGQDVGYIETPKQAIGTGLEVMSNFVGGAGAARAGVTAVKTGLKSAIKTSALTGMKAGALYGAGSNMNQDKNVLGGAALGAIGGGIIGGALPLAGSLAVGTAKTLISPFSTAINKLAPFLDSVAGKVETTVLKPSKTDLAKGFDVQNIFKYELGGTLSKSLDKTEVLINKLTTEADALRIQAKSNIDLNKIVSEAADEISTSKLKNIGSNKRIYNAFKTFVNELESVSPNGTMTSIEGQKVKVALGKLGSWLNGSRDLDSNASEIVANVLYTKFKTAVENSSGDPAALQAINKKLSEIIPINNVLIKRIPIAQRSSALSLTDIITAGAGTVDPKAWGVFAINRLSKSGRFAEAVSKTSQKLKRGATRLLPLEQKAKESIKSIKPGLTMEDVSRKLSQKETNPLTTKLLVSPDKAEREMVKNQFSKFELSDLKLSPAEYAKLIKLQDKILSDNYTIKEYKQAYDFLASRGVLEHQLKSSGLDPKNFKTAEDYVKSYSLYHGTPNELEGGVLKFGGGNQLKKGGHMGGHFLTDTPEIAENFSFGGKVYQASGDIKNQVLDVNKNKKLFQDYIGKEYLSDGEKIRFTQQDFNSIFPNGKADWSTINQDLAEQLASKQGKIGIAIPEYAAGKQGMTYQLFQDNIPVKTKSQLISEWNKANKK